MRRLYFLNVIGLLAVSFIGWSAEENYHSQLMSLRMGMADIYKKAGRQNVSEYLLEECKNKSALAEMEKKYFPLYELFVKKFYDPQCLVLEHDWELIRYFAQTYIRYAAPSEDAKFRQKAILAGLLLNENYAEIKKIIARQDKLRNAGFPLHLTSAVAGIYDKNDKNRECLMYALEQYPAKTIGSILWFISSGPGTAEVYYRELYEAIEQNPGYLDHIAVEHLCGLLRHLIINAAENNQCDEARTIRELDKKTIYQQLRMKAKGYIMTVVRKGNSTIITMRKSNYAESDFLLSFQFDQK